MKNIPLSLQIWALCTGVTLCIFGLIMLFLPNMLNGFFTRQVYALLENSQKSAQMVTITFENGDSNLVSMTSQVTPHMIRRDSHQDVSSIAISLPEPQSEEKISPVQRGESRQTEMTNAATAQSSTVVYSESDQYRTKVSVLPDTMIQILPVEPEENSSGLPPVNHLFLSAEPKAVLDSELPPAFLKVIREEAQRQNQTVQRYSHQEGDRTLLYVIRNQPLLGKTAHLVTYAWGSYTRELSNNLMKQLLWLMIALCIVSGIPSLLLARYLTRPLVEMEKAARRISERDWQEALVSERRDEIGRLTRSFDKMREHLARQDAAQQSFLQNLSHELKTPAMVISSYAQAILDGIYPRDSLEESVRVIQAESLHLQKRVQDFLYLNKLKYLALHLDDNESFYLDSLVEHTIERLRWQCPDLEWVIELTDIEVKGNRQHWAVALENLLDNQMRYAVSRVEISLMSEDQNDTARVQLRVFNDGPPIEADLLEHIFDPYASGRKGQFGLGLTIFKQIMDMHGARVSAANEEQGVAFYIEPEIL